MRSGLAARSGQHAACASIYPIAFDRIVRKRFDIPTSTYECTGADILVNLALRDLYDRDAGITRVTRPHSIAESSDDLTRPNTSYSNSCYGICEHAVNTVAREDGVAGGAMSTRFCVQAICVAGQLDMVKTEPNNTCGTGEIQSVAGIVSHD